MTTTETLTVDAASGTIEVQPSGRVLLTIQTFDGPDVVVRLSTDQTIALHDTIRGLIALPV